MLPVFRAAAAILIVAGAVPATVTAQPAAFAKASTAPRTVDVGARRVLFRVFLSDGRVLSSYGEWARLGDRVIFSMPMQLSRDPVELQLITIPSQRVDWPRTEMYAESVRAAAYAAHRGDADFAVFTSEVAKTLNEVARSRIRASGSPTAERARQKLADWPAAHYGYRIGEVREALNVLDEVIAQLRVGVGITRFDLSLSAPLPGRRRPRSRRPPTRSWWNSLRRQPRSPNHRRSAWACCRRCCG